MNILSPKKLIEVALPLDAINAAAAREKSIRHGHPSTLHLWWARRPLAAARAVIFAQLVNDPEDLWRCQNPGQEPNQQVRGHWTKARAKLFKIIEDLVLWENTTNETVLKPAREAIRQSWRDSCELNKDHPQAKELFIPDKMPGLHDPFAGGGSIPLEAQRLGLEAYASDLNPVAVLINKAMIEIPPKFAGKPPVHPGARASRPHLPQLFDSIAPADLSDEAWHSRGYLPHLDAAGLIQSITFRLADSVPAQVILQWKAELGIANRTDVPADDPRMVQLRERISTYEDAGHGECFLKQPAIAQLVNDALLHFDGQRYRLLAWCVMPNHVHVLIETIPNFPLADVVQSWKSFTSKAANKLLSRKGVFWAPDYYDRFIRNASHYESVVYYFEQNPVKAGLVKNAHDWKYSSAGARASRPLLDASDEKAGETPAFPGTWSGAAGLAEDVRRYGQWMRDEAFKRIGHLYPPIKVTKAMAKDRPDLEQYVGEELTIIAWLWARTVRSPNPAFSSVEVPLVSTFTLSSREGQESYVAPVIGKMGYQFTVKIGIPSAEAKAGTKASRGNFRCLMSQAPIDGAFLRTEGKAARMGRRLMAIVAEGSKGRVYLSPDIDQETIANTAKPIWKPDVDFFSGGVRIPYRKLWHDKVERSIHPKTTRSLNDI